MKVVLADDAALFRAGIARLLTDAGFEVAGQAADVDELLELVRSTAPEVAIVDIRMPPTHTTEGLRAADRIRAEHPKVAVLVLSQYVEPHYAMKLLGQRSSAVGYLLKDRVTDADELAEAVTRVAAGRPVVDPAVVAELLASKPRRDPLAAMSELVYQLGDGNRHNVSRKAAWNVAWAGLTIVPGLRRAQRTPVRSAENTTSPGSGLRRTTIPGSVQIASSRSSGRAGATGRRHATCRQGRASCIRSQRDRCSGLRRVLHGRLPQADRPAPAGDREPP